MNLVTYFAYGSNMSLPRLQERIPGARHLGNATLADHRLAFHKISIDGSGKCDIVAEPGSTVHGVLFEMPYAGLLRLDQFEGAGYARVAITVMQAGGEHVQAEAYRATSIDPVLRPYAWYKQHILHGARSANLPLDYIRNIELIETLDDQDCQRVARELAIYQVQQTVPSGTSD